MRLRSSPRKAILALLFAATPMALAGSASASVLTVTSYDMPNGDGQASGGTFNYWDRNYTGAGATTVDQAALSGGVGVLTDGHRELLPWFNVSNVAGTGPYVGWRWTLHGDPTIKFHFAGTPTVDSIAVAVDGSMQGGVFAPISLTINGTTYAPTVTSLSATSRLLTVSGLSLFGGTITLVPNHSPLSGSQWDFLSEVTFTGKADVPEPSTIALIGMALLSLFGLGMMRRRTDA